MDISTSERTVSGLFRLAHSRLKPEIWDYLMGGAESETTIARNRASLDAREFLPRVLRDVTSIATGLHLFGHSVDLPIFLAPIGSLSLFNEAAALASGKAAAAARVPMFLSIMAAPSLEDIARLSPGTCLVLQLYIRGDRAWLDATVQRAEQAGCAALCLTVDSAVYGRRERDLTNGFSSAAAVDRVNFKSQHHVQITSAQAGLTWETIAWLRSRTRLPLILKGIMTPEDALLGVEHGIDVVYISNHGGRQLDHTAATLDQLELIAPVIAGRSKILIDSGFMSGTDVLKALALGADAVGLGKAQGAALAAGGQHGVERLLAILGDEIKTAMALLGCTKITDVGPACLRRTSALAATRSAIQ
ncbi:alpha-hydroxy-acid oxidizing protein [Tardiphaga sp. vice154]|uniref:alpha-hydroxy acid oxidase n=1 Tax=Tardiphaga sp. vice154 TaxID=2592814 RepID=UPI0011656A39|nr:alpha-hydroxy acid oxidase [Tardiphaga sp. vice154]QDM20789.1 alpha-hydroxy-acid oxidizing protein [Tardiphaga sp. vice154]